METVKGFKDKTGKEAQAAQLIQEIAKQTFEKYNYNYVETPIIEYEEFVKSGSDEGDDAISEIFKLTDKGNRKLALRYEFTFQLKRIANMQKLPFKRFQIGPVFRDEPVKGNRVRQLTQCDIDTVGAKVKDQAEILAAFQEILTALKIDSTIYVNNRKLLNEILDEYNIENKIEAIRELDKLDKLPEEEVRENLENLGAEKLLEVVKQPREYFKKYPSYAEIEELEKYCSYYGIKIKFLPSLSRGLSYYTGNVWEIKSPKIKETICGGGTYMIGNNVGTGISFSIERMIAVSNILIDIKRILVVSLNEDKKAIQISNQLRKQGENASVFFGKPNKAFDYAEAYNIKKILFVGKKECETKKFKIKDINTGKEITITIEKKKKIKL
ncbi:MAG: ATP phosphoribosyltransferase regulatory subunit [Nanoarchaeota archaeon]|jgi:histidyl-tRNA synthetase|nr:ATP phosphoribosyltransferase regulatory subunit [Nanoarchaeota archaeon]